MDYGEKLQTPNGPYLLRAAVPAFALPLTPLVLFTPDRSEKS